MEVAFDLCRPEWRFSAPPGAVAAHHEQRDGTLILATNGTKTCFGRWLGPEVEVQVGACYALRVDVRLEGIPLRDPREHVYAIINWIGENGQPVMREYIDGYEITGGSLVLSQTLAAPKEAVRAQIELAMKWLSSGSVVFTGVSIRAVDPPPARKMRLAAGFSAFPGTREGNFAAVLAVIDRAAREKADLLCLGETALSHGLSLDECAVTIPGPETDALCAKARLHAMVIVVGLAERDGGVYYNTACVIDSDGTLRGKYRKVHLPQAEIEMGFNPGYDFPVFDTAVGRIGVMICWDMVFPEHARRLADQGAEILCAPSYMYSELETPARAADNAVFVVVSTPRWSAAPGRVIDPKGHVIALCAGGEEHECGVCIAEVDVRQRHYTYWMSVGPSYGEHRSARRQTRRTDAYAPITKLS